MHLHARCGLRSRCEEETSLQRAWSLAYAPSPGSSRLGPPSRDRPRRMRARASSSIHPPSAPDTTGVFVSAIPLSGGMSLPCSVDFSHDGRFYVICSLGDADHPSGKNPGGCIGIFRQDDDKLVSLLEIDKQLGIDGFDHPHDAVFLPSGDLAFCTWGTARVAYLRRLNARMQ